MRNSLDVSTSNQIKSSLLLYQHKQHKNNTQEDRYINKETSEL